MTQLLLFWGKDNRADSLTRIYHAKRPIGAMVVIVMGGGGIIMMVMTNTKTTTMMAAAI